MSNLFTPNSTYKKGARFAAILWTLLIFILCLLPAADLPDVHVALLDKWTHFVLFGVFSLLWLLAYPGLQFSRLFYVFIVGVFLGWLIEFLQGYFTSLGRSKEDLDIVADGIGCILGIIVFVVGARRAIK